MNVHSQIKDLEVQIQSLNKLRKAGIINTADAVVEELIEKEFKLKEKEVLKVHKHTITETLITKNGKAVKRWQTYLGDKRPRCSTYEALIEKMYAYYFEDLVITDYSFQKVFELALSEKIATENPKEKTIRDYHSSYKAFISNKFGAKDIRLMKPSEVKTYIQEVTQKLQPTKKRLYKFKGILNLVFEYAADPERHWIDINPVPHNNRVYVKNCTHSSKNPEDKAFQPEEVEMIRDYLWDRINTMKYDVNGYAILFSSETGVREGEIPSLKWSDIGDKRIHIHSQQNDKQEDGKKVYYYNPTTKDEKGVSRNGRYIPINQNVKKILNSIKKKQEELGIQSEWVFCKEDGTWTTTVSYYEALYRLSKKLGLKLSNNHAFRMALNSYVFVPMGLPATERAKLLGHSVETNLKHYTFARTDEYLDDICDKWDSFIETKKGVPQGTPNA